MKPEIVTTENLSDWNREQVTRFVMGPLRIDHRGDYDPGDGVIRRIAKIHVTSEAIADAGYYSPMPWKGQGYPLDPYVAVESTDGMLTGIQHCSPATAYKQEFCAMMYRPEDETIWIFTAPGRTSFKDLIGLDDLSAGKFEVFQLHGQSEECIEQIGPVSEGNRFSEGEFGWSVEDKPELVGCAWWSEIGPEDMLDQSKLSEQRAIRDRMKEIVDTIHPVPALLEAWL